MFGCISFCRFSAPSFKNFKRRSSKFDFSAIHIVTAELLLDSSKLWGLPLNSFQLPAIAVK